MFLCEILSQYQMVGQVEGVCWLVGKVEQTLLVGCLLDHPQTAGGSVVEDQFPLPVAFSIQPSFFQLYLPLCPGGSILSSAHALAVGMEVEYI